MADDATNQGPDDNAAAKQPAQPQQGKPQPNRAPAGPAVTRRDQAAAQIRLGEFTVEFGDDNNRNPTISTFKVGVRGHFSIVKLHQRATGGGDIGDLMGSFPEIPGQRLTVFPRELRSVLWDPIEADEDLRERITKRGRLAGLIGSDATWTAVPRTEQRLDPDTLKTLLIELRNKHEAGHLRVIEGRLPETREIEQLPGRQLYDPFNSGRKPKYVDEVQAWEEKLDNAKV